MSNTPLSNKNHSKKTNSSRDRDKNKFVASESGGSSQCDTPPLTEKDGGPSQGRFAGISPDSVMCMAEQIGAELNAEAANNLAEDVSYKLRQTISTLALHSEMLKKSRLDAWDVNSVLMLSDTSPVVGACGTLYTTFGEDKLCCPIENFLNVTDYALTTQSYVYSTLPTVSVEWITDDRSLNNNSNISVALQNYYTKVARAILNLRRKPKELAVQDLMTNTRIGPIFPNLFNLAVLVLNDDNLNALNVPAKKPLQANVLDMVDALCSNPCSLDTNIQQQFQRLFPVMVSNILGNGSLAEKMVAILTKIIRTWPPFITIGKSILFDYLSQGTKERLTAPMIKCVSALGRRMLVDCLGDHLDHLDSCLHAAPAATQPQLRDAILEASTCLLRSEPTTYLEDYVTTDYTLYEMLGDSIMPRRLIFPYRDASKHEDQNAERSNEEDFSFMPLRPVIRRPKLRLVPPTLTRNPVLRDLVFEPTKFRSDKCIQIKIRNCRTQVPRHRMRDRQPEYAPVQSSAGVVVASRLLNRFKCKLNKSNAFPIFGAVIL
ncbi:uncharacterized protein LOC115450149 [Manduca sexta]|uniref:Transcription initiation factor TFIID subunit 6 n=1 Tax=Manduca sexta TaxID=7130 RepID=A0A921ZNY3_MANSE|nr:uncharacterized protein LOC115450149 [Manduca sexta]KAG6460382.1 hypothetical protein O3G_MSEX011952 [Manduca sexta]